MKPQAKRNILIVLMVITGLATLGLIAGFFLLSGYDGEEFILMSGMGLCFLVLASFAAFTSLNHPIWKFPALAGMALSAILMFLHPLVAMMIEQRSYTSDDRFILARLDAFGFTLAGLLCLIPFIAAPNIKPLGRLLQFAVACSYLLIFAFFQVNIWADNPHRLFRDAECIIFTPFAFAIAGTIAIFILNKFLGIQRKETITYSYLNLQLQCPRCQTLQYVPEGESACQSCKLKFKIETSP